MELSYHERMLETNAIGIENPETETELFLKYWDGNYAEDYKAKRINPDYIRITTKYACNKLKPHYGFVRREKLEPIADFEVNPASVMDRKVLDLTTEYLEDTRKDLDWLDDVLSGLFPPDQILKS